MPARLLIVDSSESQWDGESTITRCPQAALVSARSRFISAVLDMSATAASQNKDMKDPGQPNGNAAALAAGATVKPGRRHRGGSISRRDGTRVDIEICMPLNLK